ncbi:unnamed protein product [Owenia fusiformis]|uniref:Uncharacterized protein n=1 Tax=Owenia fusiformis TaxID=6347 RepID=A0A8J1UFU4_OWEFU|nr:unnamed protein product [Owenia fusiformis]
MQPTRLGGLVCLVGILLCVTIAKGQDEDNGDCGADIVIAIDTSCSVKYSNKRTTRKFVVDIARKMNIGDGLSQIQIGVLTYNQGITHQFYMNDAKTNNELEELAKNITLKEVGCWTHTHTALREMRTTYFTKEHGDRKSAPNIGILMTDGLTAEREYQPDTQNEAAAARAAGIEMFAIGLPSRAKDTKEQALAEWRGIASKPTDQHFFRMQSFDKLTSILEDLTEKLCEVELKCTSFEFTCGNGSCIDAELHCNGDDDCGDDSDEVNCTTPTTEPSSTDIPMLPNIVLYDDMDQEELEPACNNGSFSCDNDTKCIDPEWQCDELFDCDDKTDEANCPCARDIVFVLDTSCSISMDDKSNVKKFVGEFGELFKIGQNDDETQIAALTYNDGTETQFFLNDSKTHAEYDANAAKINLDPIGCLTKTYGALWKTRTVHFTETHGDRPEVHNSVVLIGDGLTAPNGNSWRTIKQAKLLKSGGAEVFMIQITLRKKYQSPKKVKIAAKERQEIPSEPIEEHVFEMDLDDPAAVENLIGELKSAICSNAYWEER